MGGGGIRNAVNTREKWLATEAKSKTLFDTIQQSTRCWSPICMAKEVTRNSTCSEELQGSRSPMCWSWLMTRCCGKVECWKRRVVVRSQLKWEGSRDEVMWKCWATTKAYLRRWGVWKRQGVVETIVTLMAWMKTSRVCRVLSFIW